MDYKVSSIVAKISNMCNLNCSYCYVYKRGDPNYVNIPRKISNELAEKFLFRIKEHCLSNDIVHFSIILHGGETLLMGIPFYKWFLEETKKTFEGTSINIRFILQTNGTLMTDEWAQFLVENHISVGFSIDGYESIHNENRVYKGSGKGSWNDVVRGINIFKKYSDIGILSVVNTKADPVLFYHFCKEQGIHGASLLLQDANYKDRFDVDIEGTASWMIQLFDLWFDDKSKKPLRMLNPFTSIIYLILGIEEAGNDAYGLTMNDTLLLLTNGNILVTGLEKYTEENPYFNIETHTIDDVFQHPLYQKYYKLHDDSVLCDTCKQCLIKSICGGGRMSHRFSEENGFNNPTIYCETMKQLVVHIQNRLLEKLPEHIIKKTQLEPLHIDEL